MNLTIWKYDLFGATLTPHTDHATMAMPVGAVILTVQVQHGRPVLWAIVDREAPFEARHFLIVGTGRNMPGWDERPFEYVGTFQMHDGDFVGHVFELLKESEVVPDA